MENVINFENVKFKETEFIFNEAKPKNVLKKSKFIFSFVIAAYNSEKTIADTLKSIIKQDFGFEKNIQIIVVNDGSKDNTEKICEKFAKKYPNNFLLVNKENGGVSSARNAGIKFALGKYINFIDSDDMFSLNTCSEVFNFFEKHEWEIDVCAVKNELFGDKIGDSWFNQKFNRGNRVINLFSEPQIFQNSVNNCFIHKRILNQINFNEKISISEDLLLITKLLMNKYNLGVLNSCLYYYRIALNQTSLAYSARNKKDWYLIYLNEVFDTLHNYSLLKTNKFIKFVQYTLMRDLYNRFNNNTEIDNVLDDSERKVYFEKLFDSIRYIDDDVILKNNFLTNDEQLYFLNLKYGTPTISKNKKELTFTFSNDFEKKKKLFIQLNYCNFSKNHLVLEGYIPFPYIFKDCSRTVSVKMGSHKITAKCFDGVDDKYAFEDEYLMKRHFFKIELPLPSSSEQEIVFEFGLGKYRLPIVLYGFNKYFPLCSAINELTYSKNGYSIWFKDNSLYCGKLNSSALEERRANYLTMLENSDNPKAAEALYYLNNTDFSKSKKEIWILSDRHVCAGDNAEALYKYIKNNSEIDAYFALDKSSDDFERLSKEGFKLVDAQSEDYIKLFLKADKIVSSYFETRQLKCIDNDYLKPWLVNKEFVFLQHGIIKDDLSTYYSRQYMPFSMFVTSAKPEYDSIVNNIRYLCDENITKLTGLPRYDLLKEESKKEKIILLMPTWRNKAVVFGENNSNPTIMPDFKKRGYYSFYHEFLKSDKLKAILKKYGYKLYYFPHNNMIPVNSYFEDISGIKIVKGSERNYNEMFKKCSLMITDYSSTAFDFVYLRKPVIYCQGDKDEFFKSHTYVKGYFEYERDGFGPVVYKVDDLLIELEKVLANNCQIEDKYLDRTNGFYAFNDDQNCKRVLDEILKLGR